jgi:hypothetical protein
LGGEEGERRPVAVERRRDLRPREPRAVDGERPGQPPERRRCYVEQLKRPHAAPGSHGIVGSSIAAQGSSVTTCTRNASARHSTPAQQRQAPRTTHPASAQPGQAITPTVRDEIIRLNTHPAPNFGDLSRLRTGGLNALSAVSLPALIAQTPAAVVEQVQQAFTDPKAQAAVLR